MSIYTALVSAFVGIVLGSIYKLFFALQQRRVFSLSQSSILSPKQIFLNTVLFGFLRMAAIASLASYLLLSFTIHPILVSMFFIVTWLFLIYQS